MFTNDLLQKYLDAIDVKKAKAIRKLLPLYRLGLKSKDDVLAEIQVHTGYSKTIHRYIVNRDILTYEQIMHILSLYSISDIPGVVVTDFNDFIIISTPAPQVIFAISDIIFKITGVPDVLIEIEGLLPTYNMVLIPEPRIDINIDDIISQIDITLVPEPQVFTLASADRYLIDFVPEPIVTTTLSLLDQMLITIVPEPIIGIGVHGGFVITVVPEPRITLETRAAIDDRIFFGIMTGNVRPEVATFETLLSMSLTPIPADLNMFFPAGVGYYVLALPASAALRRRWHVDDFNQGNIGGIIDPIFGNLWPDPILQVFGGRSYQVYITSYVTQFNRSVTFLDSVGTASGPIGGGLPGATI